MKVLALNSSARAGSDSKTEIMLKALVDGLSDAGAEVEVVNLKDKKIRVCAGCFTCWTKTPGKCIHQDDMTKELFAKWVESDLCVYATPLFHHTVNATMKTFIERTLPVAEPYLIKEGERWSHPLRYEKVPGAVVLSVAGFPAMSAFEALQHYVNFLFGYREGRLWAEIYRPGAENLLYAAQKRNDILEATRQAGRELVEHKTILPETKARIEQPISDDFDGFAEMANVFWDSCITEGVNPKEFNKKGLIPRPNSISSFMRIMSMGFNPKGGGDTQAALQFDFTGTIEGQCHFIVNNGSIAFSDGPAEKADLTIKTPFDVWIDIMSGKADGAEMMMQGKYTAEGDTDLLIKMGQWFGS
jgi:multimeric flavodoxin WrbA